MHLRFLNLLQPCRSNFLLSPMLCDTAAVVNAALPHKHCRGAKQAYLWLMCRCLGAGLDYLSAPSGAIAAAQAAAASAFGADATFLLVNGTTVGIQAAVMAACSPGDALIIARNCHLCAFSACVLAGCHPVWVDPVVDARLGVAHGVTPQGLQRGIAAAAAAGLRVGAALVVSPTYFGACSDITGACMRASDPFACLHSGMDVGCFQLLLHQACQSLCTFFAPTHVPCDRAKRLYHIK